MEIARLGEQPLIQRLAATLSASLGPHADVVVGIGDDAALVRNAGVYQLLKTDQQVEGVHFQREWAPPEDLGWKALTVNVSDIAAMGGAPSAALVSLMLRPDVEVEWVDAFYRGLAEAAKAYGVAIVGGDTSAGPIVAVSVFLTGVPALDGDGRPIPLLRSSARPRDLVAITGSLGGAAAGLRLLQRSGETPGCMAGEGDPLTRAFLRPTARLQEGRLLAEEGVRAAIDVSDGLVGDLQRLCLASGVAAEVDASSVPVHPQATNCFSAEETLSLALTGGEDYELLFAAPSEAVERVRARVKVPVTVIGRIVEGTPGAVRVLDGRGSEVRLDGPGWRHF
jgi:thiamine-monophosphate kinase